MFSNGKEEFVQLAFAHFRELRRVAFRVCQERELADDLVQENAREVNQKDLEFHVSQVAKSVYFVENASFDYNCMFVVFAEYVMVVEAPSADNDKHAVVIKRC